MPVLLVTRAPNVDAAQDQKGMAEGNQNLVKSTEESGHVAASRINVKRPRPPKARRGH
jgi:hypothetical protein